MAAHDIQVRKGWQQFNGVNLGYMFEQYERYEEDPSQVDDKLRAFFDKWGAYSESGRQEDGERLADSVNLKKKEHIAVQASFLAESIRRNGHLIADIMPFDTEQRPEGLFNLEDFDLTKQDLQHLSPELLSPHYSEGLLNGYDAIDHLKGVYTGNIAFQFKHIQEINERKWLFREVETGAYTINLSDDDKRDLLQRLNKVEGFEHFLDKTFKGQKRFSVEGLDTMVPMLDQLVKDAVNAGSKHIFIGMAHRGRLNVLAHVLGKPYELIFSEFHDAPNPELVPSEGSTGINYGWTGDVKYHLGADREIKESASQATITLANNPSHLEFVNPVIEGLTRAAQDDRSRSGFPLHDPDLALPVLIHGDAAFPGQGVVAETINLSGLKGYTTGGTIHIIANNLLGFTTDSQDSRSTTYASDLARGFDVPIIHVNADDPETSLSAMNLAWKYRKTFGKDVVIDLIGYRRYGHNEMDEPLATQPSLYKIIQKHPTVFELYGEKLLQESKVTDDQLRKMRKEFTDILNQQFDKIKGNKRETIDGDMSPPDVVTSSLERYQKNISPDSLEKVNEELLAFPESFSVFPKLKRILERRRNAFRDGTIDWGHAEALAFATIIKDGIPIRLTGQDSERGTFSHRHLILHDYETGDTFSPMHHLSNANASFALHNSPLSETACLGFEYGYNVEAPETLTIWEAQYGDFANGAQVILDQFISSGRAKWSQKSGLVLLLPHGYEGQGPEHSSARLERFLTLAAENNWHVANVTKASQYYHLLRRQAHSLGTDYVRPLILMAPKSLIRNERVVSSAREMTEDEFKPVLVSPDMKASNQIERVILTQGKIGVELETAIAGLNEKPDWLIHVRIEELYPFPSESLRDVLQACGNIKEVIWLQEEPQNMGAWTYVMPYLQGLFGAEKISFTGRRRRSSPAEGDPKVHKLEHERMMNSVLNRSSNLKGDSQNDRD